jgi:hypothetical protein
MRILRRPSVRVCDHTGGGSDQRAKPSPPADCYNGPVRQSRLGRTLGSTRGSQARLQTRRRTSSFIMIDTPLTVSGPQSLLAAVSPGDCCGSMNAGVVSPPSAQPTICWRCKRARPTPREIRAVGKISFVLVRLRQPEAYSPLPAAWYCTDQL